eukprot:400730-Alexandrium_andersonii.AAC.1
MDVVAGATAKRSGWNTALPWSWCSTASSMSSFISAAMADHLWGAPGCGAARGKGNLRNDASLRHQWCSEWGNVWGCYLWVTIRVTKDGATDRGVPQGSVFFQMVRAQPQCAKEAPLTLCVPGCPTTLHERGPSNSPHPSQPRKPMPAAFRMASRASSRGSWMDGLLA